MWVEELEQELSLEDKTRVAMPGKAEDVDNHSRCRDSNRQFRVASNSVDEDVDVAEVDSKVGDHSRRRRCNVITVDAMDTTPASADSQSPLRDNLFQVVGISPGDIADVAAVGLVEDRRGSQ